jgi:hypothetical protein
MLLRTLTSLVRGERPKGVFRLTYCYAFVIYFKFFNKLNYHTSNSNYFPVPPCFLNLFEAIFL